MRTAPLVLFWLALQSTPAQSVTATLVANAPLSASYIAAGVQSIATAPAGPLTTSASVEAPGTAAVSKLWWIVPSSIFPGCTLRSNQMNWNSQLCSCSADLTLTLSAATPTHGHLLVYMICAGDFVGPGQMTVDVNDDGTLEADSLNSPISPSLVREWDLPIGLGTAPLAIRIRHQVSTPVFHGYLLTVEFVPWSPRATDLGSTCGVSEVGWYPTQSFPVNEQYFLAAHVAPSGDGKDLLVARGFDTFGLFVFSDTPARLPVGSIGIPMGCDDLLAAPLALIDGINTAPGEWELLVPPVPIGKRLYVQHVSVGTTTWGPPLRFGVTNLVQLQY